MVLENSIILVSCSFLLKLSSFVIGDSYSLWSQFDVVSSQQMALVDSQSNFLFIFLAVFTILFYQHHKKQHTDLCILFILHLLFNFVQNLFVRYDVVHLLIANEES